MTYMSNVCIKKQNTRNLIHACTYLWESDLPIVMLLANIWSVITFGQADFGQIKSKIELKDLILYGRKWEKFIFQNQAIPRATDFSYLTEDIK